MSTYEIIVLGCGFCLLAMGVSVKSRGVIERLMINTPLSFAGIACMFYSFAASGLI